MTDVPRTYPERPIIWSTRGPPTGSRRRPVDVPIRTFEYVFSKNSENSNIFVKQGLLHLKNTFLIESLIFCFVSLRVP